MAPLNIEVFHPVEKKWIKVGEVKPTDLPGSISNNKTDDSRDLYLFECESDDSKSIIYRSKFGADGKIGNNLREIISSGSEVIKELKKGETHEMKIKTDKNQESRLIRFTHK